MSTSGTGTSGTTFPTPEDIERIQQAANEVARKHYEPLKFAQDALSMFDEQLQHKYHAAVRHKGLRRLQEQKATAVDAKTAEAAERCRSVWEDRYRKSLPGELDVTEMRTPEERKRLQLMRDDVSRLCGIMAGDIQHCIESHGLSVRVPNPFDEPDRESGTGRIISSEQNPSYAGWHILRKAEGQLFDDIKQAQHTVDGDTRKHTAQLTRIYNTLGNDLDRFL